MKAKYQQLISVLERRIHAGDYSLEDLPSERKLAAELGVSHMTARRAVQYLIDTGLIKRESTHSRSTSSKNLLKIACLMPAFESPSLLNLFRRLSQVVAEKEGVVRPVSYTSWHDPVIMDVLDGDFDGIFMLPPSDMPQVMQDRLAKNKDRLVTVYHDLTHLGIPCVESGRSDAVMQIVSHLVNLGHRHLLMLNTQPCHPVISQRIAAWQAGIKLHHVDGLLFDEPVEVMAPADDKAMEVTKRLIEQKIIGSGSEVTAMISTTLETLRAAMRVMVDHGIRVPQDISVATCDQTRIAKQSLPSITTLDIPDPAPYLQIGLDWIMSRGQNWDRPLLIEPESVSVWCGESTIARS